MEAVGILYICTGRYRLFWDDFYRSAEQNFLPGIPKHYYVWSNHHIDESPSVTHIVCNWMGWPAETLKRFHRFIEQEERLLHHKYLFFLNANVRVDLPVEPEAVLPDAEHPLVAAVHAQFWKPGDKIECKNTTGLLEESPMSLAYIPDSSTHDYIMGGLNGGLSEVYMSMAHDLAINIDMDLANGIVARFNEESHMNHYSKTHPFKLIHPKYLHPEGIEAPYEPAILVFNKQAYNGIRGFRTNPVLPGRGLMGRLAGVKL